MEFWSAHVYRYALKNALAPVLTVIGLMFCVRLVGRSSLNSSCVGQDSVQRTNAILSLDYPAIMESPSWSRSFTSRQSRWSIGDRLG